ncbi:MAG: hypothetical protein ACRCXM_08495 [Beijerinckiaceae bacterium]
MCTELVCRSLGFKINSVRALLGFAAPEHFFLMTYDEDDLESGSEPAPPDWTAAQGDRCLCPVDAARTIEATGRWMVCDDPHDDYFTVYIEPVAASA